MKTMTDNEIIRCKNDILYFIEKYVRIKTDDGNVPLHLTESQKRYLKEISYKTNSNYEKRRIFRRRRTY